MTSISTTAAAAIMGYGLPGISDTRILSGTKVAYDPALPNGGLPMTRMEEIPAFMREIAARQPKEASASELVAARDEAARQMSASDRYQAALNFGTDFATLLNTNLNQPNEKWDKQQDALDTYKAHTTTTVSARGTVIGIGCARYASCENNTIQITRKDGFQLNLELNDNLRINDLEDGGLAVYYASSGITRIFDAEGKESIVQGETNALGTAGDDIIINRSGTHIDGGDGDDIIINFANNVDIQGGDGNDKIFLMSGITDNVTINGGAGDDAIIGYQIDNATIVMDQGKDSLAATHISSSSISSIGDDSITFYGISDSQFTAQNGAINLNAGSIGSSSISIDKVNNISVDYISLSNIQFGNGDVSLSLTGIHDSNLRFKNGNIYLDCKYGIAHSNIIAGNGDHTIQTKTNSIHNSTINVGRGNNKIYAHNATDASIFATEKNTSIIIEEKTRSSISISV